MKDFVLILVVVDDGLVLAQGCRPIVATRRS